MTQPRGRRRYFADDNGWTFTVQGADTYVAPRWHEVTYGDYRRMADERKRRMPAHWNVTVQPGLAEFVRTEATGLGITPQDYLSAVVETELRWLQYGRRAAPPGILRALQTIADQQRSTTSGPGERTTPYDHRNNNND